MGAKAGGVPMPRFSPLSQPFPATASAEGVQVNVPPSPTRGEGEKRRSCELNAELQLPPPSHWLPLLQIVQILDQPLVKSLRTGIHRIVRSILE